MRYYLPMSDSHRATESAFAARLAAHVSGPEVIPTLIGEGSNNTVYRLDDARVLKLGKPHRLGFAAAEHAKEMWCAARARAVGVATPEIMFAGTFEGRPYQLQAFVAGVQSEDSREAWRAMGQWARLFHAIPVSGWGPMLAGDVFTGSWRDHLAYNIASINADDPLLRLGVLDARLSADLTRRFERLVRTDFTLGLCHGDLGVQNMVADGATMTLIDWGCATAAPVPHHEINEMIRAGRTTPAKLEMFREAYGLSDSGWAAVVADLPDLLVLREIDTLRWAIDGQPGEIEAQMAKLKRAVAELG